MSGLYVDSVAKEIEGKNILNDIFITCKQGEIVGLLGRNGSGKSTLMKIIFGAIEADHKFIKVNDRQLFGLRDAFKFIRYLPQHTFLPSHIDVRQLISVFCPKKQTEYLFEHELVKPHLKKKSGDLSGGERRLIEIAIIIYSDAEFCLLDEPFNGVSPIQINTIKKLIRDQAQHKGFIITDHDYNSILDLSSRIILMRNGSTKAINNNQELVDFGYLSMRSEIFADDKTNGI